MLEMQAMTNFVQANDPVVHQGVQRMAQLLRRGVRSWRLARQRAVEDERTRNAALHDARIMADLSSAMNGIAVDDTRRYRF